VARIITDLALGDRHMRIWGPGNAPTLSRGARFLEVSRRRGQRTHRPGAGRCPIWGLVSSRGRGAWEVLTNMAPNPDPILNAAHVATLTWDNITDCELLRRSHEALREQVRVVTEMHRQVASDADELRDEMQRQAVAAADELRARLRDLEDDARARLAVERAKSERRVRDLEVAISNLLAWSEFAFPRGEPAAIHDARATLAH